jgi:hypothetical protein
MVDDQTPETLARARVAEVLQRHVNDRFGGNLKRAAEDLGYDRQRLYSYTSKTSFPSAEVFDNIKEKWALDLLNIDAINHTQAASPGRAPAADNQFSLFDPPVRLTNDGMEIVLERKGAAVAVRIKISPDVKIA